MSVHHWGEDPTGHWTLKVSFDTSYLNASVVVLSFDMRLYGTTEIPATVANIPTSCHPYCARGCSGPTATDCDICRNYRFNSTLECVTSCPQGTTEQSNYCFNSPLSTTGGVKIKRAANNQAMPNNMVKEVQETITAANDQIIHDGDVTLPRRD